jgi:hypothetical protein
MSKQPELSSLITLNEALTSFTQEIRCHHSNILLGKLQVLIVEGHLTYLQSHSDSIYLHPFYGLDSTVLIKKLENSLHQHQEAGWIPGWKEKERLRLLCSALMHTLGCIKQTGPSLPRHEIAVASAGRLLGLAKWFFFISSQRLAFPLYSVSKQNDNLEWENFRYWLDSAYEVRHSWATQSRELKREAQERTQAEILKQIKGEVYRPVDKKKVWNWIQIQLEGREPAGRLATYKELFLEGDSNPSDWLKDDVDDVQFAIATHCDQGNEIMYFIRKRLEGIKALIHDFYSSFTLLTKVQEDKYGSDEQTTQEKEFFAGFDATAEALEKLPPPPDRKDFATNGLWIQATARWNILKKRWEQMQVAVESKQDKGEQA